MTANKSKTTDPLRDQIAVRAMEIIVGGDHRAFMEQVCMPDPAPAASLNNIARLAYGLADAMLAARKS